MIIIFYVCSYFRNLTIIVLYLLIKPTIMISNFTILKFILFFSPIFIMAQEPFITDWKTDEQGSSAFNEIIIPASGSFDYTWQEVDVPTNIGSGNGSGNYTIVFPQPGIYKVSLVATGSQPFHSIIFNDEGDKNKLMSIAQWGDVVWSTMANAFSGCTNLEITATDAPNLSNVEEMTGMFSNATSINQPIGHWNLSQVVDISGMFANATSFNQPLDSWDVSSVEMMNGTFFSATNFNQSLANWNVSNVNSMTTMFMGASSFNQNLETWSVSNVTNMEGMFAEASSFNQPLETWDMSQVTVTSGMFFQATSFNQPLETWDMSNVLYTAGMFDGATIFNQPLNNWDVSNVEVMASMFANTPVFNQPLNNWDVSQRWLLAQMFFNATAFNQDLGAWQLNNLMVGDQMFDNSGMGCENYSRTLQGWAANPSIAGGITLGATGMEFSPDVVNDRDILVTQNGWTINGDNQGSCVLSIASLVDVNIALYPNPATHQIDISGLKGNETVKMFDSAGRILKTQQVMNTTQSIDLTNFATGLYFINVINMQGENSTFRLIKK